MRDTNQLVILGEKFGRLVSEHGGHAGLIHHLIDSRAEKGEVDRKQSCWIDMDKEIEEKHEDVPYGAAHINHYCVGCAEKIVIKIIAEHPELKGEIYIRDGSDVDADSSPSCAECEELITYSLVAADFELDTFLGGGPYLCDSVCYEIYRLIEDCGYEISDEDMRKLALRVFFQAETGEVFLTARPLYNLAETERKLKD